MCVGNVTDATFPTLREESKATSPSGAQSKLDNQQSEHDGEECARSAGVPKETAGVTRVSGGGKSGGAVEAVENASTKEAGTRSLALRTAPSFRRTAALHTGRFTACG